MRHPIAIVWICVLVRSADLSADHPTLSLGEGTTNPLTTISAVPLEAGQTAVGLRQQMIFNDELTDAEFESASESGGDVHSIAAVYSTSLGGALGLTDNLTIGFQLPYLSKREIREAHHEDHVSDEGHSPPGEEQGGDTGVGERSVEEVGDSSGLGDARLYGQYRFWNNANADVSAAVLFGIKTPTGRTNEISAEGDRFEAEHQPGSGSWDPIAGLAWSRSAGRLNIDTNALYTFANKGSRSTNLGDVFNYNLAFSLRLRGSETDEHAHPDHAPHEHGHTAWDVIFEVNGDWRGKVEKPDGVDDNTGGNIIYLSAATRLSWGAGWAAYLSAGVPVLKKLNGLQSEPEARLLFGIGKGF